MDRAEAARLYRRSAYTGHMQATYLLANLYHCGEDGVVKDAAEAFKLFKRYVKLEAAAPPFPGYAAGVDLDVDTRGQARRMTRLGRAVQADCH